MILDTIERLMIGRTVVLITHGAGWPAARTGPSCSTRAGWSGRGLPGHGVAPLGHGRSRHAAEPTPGPGARPLAAAP